MRYVGLLFVFILGCSQTNNLKYNVQGDFAKKSGWVSVFQTFTSSDQTSINILRPRLTKLGYYVVPDSGDVTQFDSKGKVLQKVIKTTKGPKIHWQVDRIHVNNLQPGVNYRLLVVNLRRNRVIDWRRFKTLDLAKKQTRFVVGSCMSDSHAFSHVRERIWDRMLTHDADFLMLLGDQVYVDDYDFVKRGQVTEFDLWTRYIDSFRKIPLFQNRQLIPILAVWDDHDYGTNNSDKTFPTKKAARKVFQAFFGGEKIPGVIETANKGVSFSYNGFGQKFLLMDNRYYREPSAKKNYGHWGKDQHKWFLKQMTKSSTPVWLANGGQFFTNATFVKNKGKSKKINESFKDDHPVHYKTLIKDLKAAKKPVLFLSGDIHYSEVVQVEPELFGYQTYEITSSPIHSYIYRSKTGKETYLDNPRRLLAIKDHNYVVVESAATKNQVQLKVESYGVKQKEAFFSKKLIVTKP